MKQTLRWIHISDLHVGAPAEPAHSARAQRVGLQEIADHYLQQFGGDPPDLVFFTGDLAFSAQTTEYHDLLQRWESFRDQLNVAKEKTFVVPGNHDVQRSEYVGRERRGIVRGGVGTHAQHLEARLGNYMQAAEQMAHPVCSTAGSWTCVQHGAEKPSVRITGLNTSLLCNDADDQGKLVVPDKRGLDEDGPESHSMHIVIGHHPLHWLYDTDMAELLSTLLRQECVYLCGHVHKQQYLTYRIPGVASRSLYVGISAPVSSGDGVQGYSVTEAERQPDGAIRLKAYRYKWDEDSGQRYVAQADRAGCALLRRGQTPAVETDMIAGSFGTLRRQIRRLYRTTPSSQLEDRETLKIVGKLLCASETSWHRVSRPVASSPTQPLYLLPEALTRLLQGLPPQLCSEVRHATQQDRQCHGSEMAGTWQRLFQTQKNWPDIRFYAGLGWAYSLFKGNQLSRALGVYNRLRRAGDFDKKSPEFRLVCLYRKGLTELAARHYAEALSSFQEVEDLRPNVPAKQLNAEEIDKELPLQKQRALYLQFCHRSVELECPDLDFPLMINLALGPLRTPHLPEGLRHRYLNAYVFYCHLSAFDMKQRPECEDELLAEFKRQVADQPLQEAGDLPYLIVADTRMLVAWAAGQANTAAEVAEDIITRLGPRRIDELSPEQRVLKARANRVRKQAPAG